MGFAYPLYRVSLGSSSEFAISFLLLAIIQVWNVLIHWHEIRLSTVRSSRWIWSSTFVRWLVNVVTTMVILEKVWTGLIALFPVLSLIFLYVQKITPAFPYPWAKLRDQEQRTLAKYYATARWFFDLPQVPTTIKRRKVLIQLLDRFLPKQQAFAYLYWRSFVRKSELFSIYLRLIVWVMFMTVILPYPWFIVFLYLLGLWLFAIQLPAIANHRLYPIWVRLYPISANEQTHTLKQMGFVLLGLQNVLYTLFLLLVNPLPFVVTIGLGIAGLGFNYLLSAFYLPGQIKKL
jgi:ABC-2 type transport system permease protein